MKNALSVGILFVLVITVILSTASAGIGHVFAAEDAERVGVGVGTGKIIIDDALKPGARYDLTPLSVINTGYVAAEYEILTTYHEQQKEKRPDLLWFAFTPNHFILNPGEVKAVEISLLLPLKAEPGDYFAYLEAHPIRTVKNGSTAVGVAAAAKLYFKVQPANVFQAIYYRTKSLYVQYQVATNVVAVTLLVFSLISIARKFVSFDVKLKPKHTQSKTDTKTEADTDTA